VVPCGHSKYVRAQVDLNHLESNFLNIPPKILCVILSSFLINNRLFSNDICAVDNRTARLYRRQNWERIQISPSLACQYLIKYTEPHLAQAFDMWNINERPKRKIGSQCTRRELLRDQPLPRRSIKGRDFNNMFPFIFLHAADLVARGVRHWIRDATPFSILGFEKQVRPQRIIVL